MKKPLTTAWCFFVLIQVAYAQMHNGRFGNEWIDLQQNYFKIRLTESGLYKIDRSVLERDGVPVAQIAPQAFELWHMGKQVPVHVETQNGQLSHLLFYAQNQQALLDVNLYRDSTHQFNPHYSLVTDTAVYFLTWKNTGQGEQLITQISNFQQTPAKETHYIHRSQKVFSDTWNRGWTQTMGGYTLAKSTYDVGEGYGSSNSVQHQVQLPTPHIYSNGGMAEVHIRAASSAWRQHSPQLQVGSYIKNYPTFFGDSLHVREAQVPLTELGANQANLTFRGLSGNTDAYTLSMVEISYPRTFNFENKAVFAFEMPASTARQYLEIEDFDGQTQYTYLYDLTNQLRISCFWHGTTVHVVLPPSANDRQLVLVNEAQAQEVQALQAIAFEDYQYDLGNYVIITHPKLRNDAQGNDPVFDYMIYRAKTGYMPTIVSIQELYNQFAYGHQGHPIAIKNFVAYIKQHWQQIPPEYVFLIGKGRQYTQVRYSPEPDNLIPTLGEPVSDNLLFAPIGSDVPMLPFGRLSATTGDQVQTYLSKVKALEQGRKTDLSYQNQVWRKRIVHLGGGKNLFEQNMLKSHLLELENRLDTGLLGANVHAFFKQQADYITVPNTKMIDSLINDGVGLVTFYGHGNVKGFDYYLNLPNYYKNKNKYPLILALGCYNGTMYRRNQLMSEKFVFEPEAGAAGYMAFVDAVTVSATRDLSRFFYQKLDSLPNVGVGVLMQKALTDFTQIPNYPYYHTHQMASHYMVYHGDPALKINTYATPDYLLDSSQIILSPKNISTKHRQFTLSIKVFNAGRFVDSLIDIQVIRKLPRGQNDTLTKQIEAPRIEQVVDFQFPIKGYEDLGINEFDIYVDVANQVNEKPHPYAEANNQLTYRMRLGNSEVVPIYPKPYAIVSDSTISLRAIQVNALGLSSHWIMEIDTNDRFDSPLWQQEVVHNHASNLLEWTPTINWQANQVYYWRARGLSSDSTEWAERSFVYLPQAQTGGWNQSHIYQYQDNSLEQLNANGQEDAPFAFNPSLYEISAKTGFIPDAIDDNNLALYSNGSKVDKCRCSGRNGLYVAVFDPQQMAFWQLPGHTSRYGAINCDGAGRPAYAFLFRTELYTARQDLYHFLKDSIPQGHIVLMYSLNKAYPMFWDNNLVNHLKSQGATQIDSFVQSGIERPYAFVYQQGNPSYAYRAEMLGEDRNSVVSIFGAAPKAWDKGQMTSPIIGPYQQWEQLQWATHSQDSSLGDSSSLDVFGIDPTGKKVLLYANYQDSVLDLSNVNASVYPYLQLRWHNQDPHYQTAVQLDYWRVWGQPSPDQVLVVDQNYQAMYDTIRQEDSLVLDLQVLYLGAKPPQHTQLNMHLLGESLTQYELDFQQQASTSIQLHIPMVGLVGKQELSIQVDTIGKEANLVNNWGWLNFFVKEDGGRGTSVDQLATNQTSVWAYPNPFDTRSTIRINLSNQVLPDYLHYEVFDAQGRLIQTHQQSASMINEWQWNGQDQSGQNLKTGLYYCRVSPIYTQERDLPTWSKTIKLMCVRSSP